MGLALAALVVGLAGGAAAAWAILRRGAADTDGSAGVGAHLVPDPALGW